MMYSAGAVSGYRRFLVLCINACRFEVFIRFDIGQGQLLMNSEKIQKGKSCLLTGLQEIGTMMTKQWENI